ncbi:hypothetical protein TSARBOMBA_90 [Bacillus phage TsarBomba]|uniref:Uncharacterized protein n=1 Tax=Bacillus phage TsarBomba TaxID=1690456 RepID=A0A0K2CZW0_9CAUD|nr:hypothetical protein TSARBOMBA_90 [Bacillus phage TsarBomba]ALA13020.1 hypothetical protein TSARBOMBA_90 [Bacillus phage TsarBomba]
MTIVLTEREAILRKMDYIEKERTALWTSYETCLDRLRELDEIDRLATEAEPAPIKEVKEIKVTENIVVNAFENMTEDERKKFAQELQKMVTKDVAKIVQEPNEIAAAVIEVPKHKADQPIQEYIEENKEVVSLPEEEPKFEYNHAKELAKDMEYKNRNIKNPVRKGNRKGKTKYPDLNVVAQYTKVILKDAGIPTKIKVIFEKLKEINPEYAYKNPYDIIKKLNAIDPRIEKIGNGYYQYNTSK